MSQPYTSGDWYVQVGRETAFIAAWQDLADWTAGEAPGAGWARLLQDRDDPRHFVSVGPWSDDAAIEAWRASEGFQQRVGRLRELLERFEPRTFDEVGGVAAP